MDFIEGEVLVLYKPKSWTSFDLVRKIRGMAKHFHEGKKVKVGHAGTLDPLAEGLMIVCTGRKTKTIDQIQAQEKTYIAEMTLGATRPSYDMETEIDQTFETNHITLQLVQEALRGFVGVQEQIPPVFSAKRINGTRAYEYARKGRELEMKANQVTINQIELLELDLPKLRIEVQCSKGTYIRSLVSDIGKKLDSGAYLSHLVRTGIGDYTLENCMQIEELQNKIARLDNNPD